MADFNILAFFLRQPSKLKIASLLLDCSVDESHDYTSNITDYPQEDGFEVQDNVWLEPFKLSVKGVITDTPVAIFAEKFGVLESRVGNAYDTLLALRDSRDGFQVLTGIKIYDDMVFTSLSIKRDTDTGFSIKIEADLKQLRKVSATRTVDKQHTKNNSFINRKNKGSQQLQPTNPDAIPDQNKTDFQSTFGGLIE